MITADGSSLLNTSQAQLFELSLFSSWLLGFRSSWAQPRAAASPGSSWPTWAECGSTASSRTRVRASWVEAVGGSISPPGCGPRTPRAFWPGRWWPGAAGEVKRCRDSDCSSGPPGFSPGPEPWSAGDTGRRAPRGKSCCGPAAPGSRGAKRRGVSH